MALITIATFGLSLATLQIVPITDDLYNLVYDNSRLFKPESTYNFLFVFPFMQLVLLAVTCARLGGLIEVSKEQSEIGRGVAILGSIVIFSINAWRCFNTWEVFG